MSKPIKDKNETIRIPEDAKLFTSDGREFSIFRWETESAVGEWSTVKCVMSRMDEGSQKKDG